MSGKHQRLRRIGNYLTDKRISYFRVEVLITWFVFVCGRAFCGKLNTNKLQPAVLGQHE